MMMSELTPQRRPALGAARLAALLGAAGAFAVAAVQVCEAADHREAPGSTALPVADLNDFYAWHDVAANKLVTVITFSPFVAGDSVEFDDDILYGVHIDNNADNVADIDVWVRFGPDSLGNWGMQVENLPGRSTPVVGAVESIIYTEQGRYVYAGLRDDPFFFDLEGFQTTLQTGSLTFDSSRDSFAGANTAAIVLEMDLNAALGGGTTLQTWATTASRDL